MYKGDYLTVEFVESMSAKNIFLNSEICYVFRRLLCLAMYLNNGHRSLKQDIQSVTKNSSLVEKNGFCHMYSIQFKWIFNQSIIGSLDNFKI